MTDLKEVKKDPIVEKAEGLMKVFMTNLENAHKANLEKNPKQMFVDTVLEFLLWRTALLTVLISENKKP